ncbi:MAG TPA: hypothetical protein VG322_08595 [Candidatus Acidoferrales bacterium]|jgi:hypothetical protein|nr:hypothetical protein [Candidatus Acidoferrales bacterium]
MFARRVQMRLKANCVAELTHKLDTEVIPMLRKLKGFQDEITFVTQSGTEAFAISLWDRAESADVYNRTVYPNVMKIVSQYIDGTPQIETFDVTNSTFHKIIPAGLV